MRCYYGVEHAPKESYQRGLTDEALGIRNGRAPREAAELPGLNLYLQIITFNLSADTTFLSRQIGAGYYGSVFMGMIRVLAVIGMK